MTVALIRYGASAALPLETLLSMIPSLPRAALDRLTQRMIDRMDEIDGDPDAEDDDQDECLAGDDGCGPVLTPWGTAWGYEGDMAG